MHISASVSLWLFFCFNNEEKLAALLIYSSFQPVATSGIRNSSVASSTNKRIR